MSLVSVSVVLSVSVKPACVTSGVINPDNNVETSTSKKSNVSS